ncbi:THBS2, partial [Symbiodinium microadriaticum]
VETAPCNTEHCEDSECVDGTWGEWSEWESCSMTCKGGVTWRSRAVQMEANDCGHPPLGYSMEHRACNYDIACNPNQDC